jgi:phosphoribosylformylglycinamidine synthase
MVGLVHDLDHVTGLGWQAPGDHIWLLGVPLATGDGDGRLALAASSYLESVHGLATGRPPLTDLKLERAVQALLRQAITTGLVASAHDLSDGGLAVAAAEACIASGLGAVLEIPADAGRLDRLLFAEGGARVLVSIKSDQERAWQELLDAQRHGEQEALARPIGRVGAAGVALSFQQAGTCLMSLAVEELRISYENALPRRLAAAG